MMERVNELGEGSVFEVSLSRLGREGVGVGVGVGVRVGCACCAPQLGGKDGGRGEFGLSKYVIECEM